MMEILNVQAIEVSGNQTIIYMPEQCIYIPSKNTILTVVGICNGGGFKINVEWADD